MTSKKISYTLRTRVACLGKYKDKQVIQAYATQRKRVDHRSFCAEVARGTSFQGIEVEAVLRLAAEVAKAHVERGESVDFGDMGMLTPTFRSKLVEGADEKLFDAKKHISSPRIKLLPSRRYFQIKDANFERVYIKQKDKKTQTTPVVPPSNPDEGEEPEL